MSEKEGVLYMKKMIVLPALLLIAVFSIIAVTCNPPDPDDPTFISVVSSTYEMPADDSTTATITATVYDNTHNFVEDGTAVYFVTNKGDLDSGVATTSGGQASVTLTADDNEGFAIVSVNVPAENRNAQSSPITMYGITPKVITVIAEPNQIKANENDKSTLSATVMRDDDKTLFVPDGTEVTFTADRGTSLSNTTAVTADGVAKVTLTAGTDSGTCNITATAGEEIAGTTIQLNPIDATYIQINADQYEIRADGSSKTTIEAQVWLDYPYEYVQDGTTVYFATTLGSIPDSATTKGGFAYVELTSASTSGYATITGTSGGEKDTAQVYFFDTGPYYITISANPNSIPADGISGCTINAIVRNSKGEPVSGTTVKFSTTRGILNPTSASTDNSGAAQSTLTSTTTIDNNVRVTAVAGPAAATVRVWFTQPSSDDVAYVTVDSNIDEIVVDSNEQPIVTVRVFNQFNVGIPDKFVYMDTECGQFLPGDADQTNNNGRAQFLLDLSTCTDARTITLTGTSDNVAGTDTITIIPAEPCNLYFTADSYVLDGSVSGGGSTTLRMTVTDRFGNFAEDLSTISLVLQSCTCDDCTGIQISPSTAYTSSGAANASLSVSSGTATTDDCSITIRGTANGAANICATQGLNVETVTISIKQ